MEEKISIRPDVLETLTRIDMQMDAAKADGNDEEFNRLSKERKQWLEYVNLTFLTFEKNGRYGVMLSDGRVVENAVYDKIWMDDGNVIVLAKKGCEWIILYEYLTRINQHIICKELVPTNWASMYLALVNGLWGLYDSDKQEWLLEPKYDGILDYASCFKIKKKRTNMDYIHSISWFRQSMTKSAFVAELAMLASTKMESWATLIKTENGRQI